MANNPYNIDGIKISHTSEIENYPPFVQEKLEEFFHKTNKKNIPWKVVEDLKALIKRFPDVPHFKGFLAVAYENLKKYEFRKNLLINTIEKQPDYVFARLDLANHYLNEEDDSIKASEVLNESVNISDLFPEKKLFQKQEIAAFYTLIFDIELDKGNYEHAHFIADFFEKNKGIISEEEILDMRMTIMNAKMKDDDYKFPFFKETPIEPVISKVIEETADTENPVLHNDLLYKLYDEKIYLEKEITDEILKLDRTSLIEDLKTILKDAENRYSYFQDLAEEEKYYYFPCHALWLLKELKAEESLENILDFFRNDSDFLEFWLMDELTEYGWSFIYETGKNKLQTLKDFLCEAGIDAFAKSAILDAIVYLYVNQPERHEEIYKVFNEIAHCFNASSEEDNLISSTFLGFFVWDALTINKELYKDVIRELFEKDYVDEAISGSYDDIMADELQPEERKMITIDEYYKGLKKMKN